MEGGRPTNVDVWNCARIFGDAINRIVECLAALKSPLFSLRSPHFSWFRKCFFYFVWYLAAVGYFSLSHIILLSSGRARGTRVSDIPNSLISIILFYQWHDEIERKNRIHATGMRNKMILNLCLRLVRRKEWTQSNRQPNVCACLCIGLQPIGVTQSTHPTTWSAKKCALNWYFAGFTSRRRLNSRSHDICTQAITSDDPSIWIWIFIFW